MKEFKGVWHKIADGDLPEFWERVLVSYLTLEKELDTAIGYLGEQEFEDGVWKRWYMDDDDIFILEFDEVVAWMELPEYDEEPRLFLNSKSYKIDDDKLSAIIFYQDKGEWKLCCKGEGFSEAVSIESDEIILDIKNLEFDSDFAKSHDIADRWDKGLRFKVLFKGMATSIDGKHPVDILCNNCEVLYQENDSLVLKALRDENGEKMQLIIEDDDNYKK